jgi:hypothetical protein
MGGKRRGGAVELLAETASAEEENLQIETKAD